MYAHACGGQGSTSGVSSNTLPNVLRWGISPKLEFTHLVRLAGQRAPRIILPSTEITGIYRHTCIFTWVLWLRPQAFMLLAGMMSTETSFQPFKRYSERALEGVGDSAEGMATYPCGSPRNGRHPAHLNMPMFLLWLSL